jgi:uncharacterized DUF497 family protein
MGLRFTWSPRKAANNRRKHGVSFEEAATAFGDPLSITIPDPDHSKEEERFILIGMSVNRRSLVVVPVERAEDEYQIISARLATRHERTRYEEG